jgi:hypothetical protein
MEEGGRIYGARTAIKGVVNIGLRAREDFYGRSLRMCDPLERSRTGAGSLRGE